MQDTSSGFRKIVYGDPAKPISDFVVGLDKNRYPYTSIPDAVAAAGQRAGLTGAAQVVYVSPNPIDAPWQLGSGAEAMQLPNFVSILGTCGDRFAANNPVNCQGQIVIGNGDNAEPEGHRSLCDITIDNRGTSISGCVLINDPGFSDTVLQRVRLRCDVGVALDASANSIGLYMNDSFVTSNDPALPACRIAFLGGFPFAIVSRNNINNPAGGRALELDGVTWLSSLSQYAAVGVPCILADFTSGSHSNDDFTAVGIGTAIDVVDTAISIIGMCLFNSTGPNVIDGATSTVRWFNGLFSGTLTAPSVSAALTRIGLQNQPGATVAFP